MKKIYPLPRCMSDNQGYTVGSDGREIQYWIIDSSNDCPFKTEFNYCDLISFVRSSTTDCAESEGFPSYCPLWDVRE